MMRRRMGTVAEPDTVNAVLYGGPGDGQQIRVPYESIEHVHGGMTYRRDPDPLRRGGPRRYLAEGIAVHEHGGLATRLAGARERAGGDRKRQHLALAPLVAEAYALGARVIRDPDGGLQVAQPHRKAPEPGEHVGLVELVAARLRDQQSLMGASITLLVYNFSELRAGAEDGLFDFDSTTPGVIDLERGRVWPFVPAFWRNVCHGCAWPVTSMHPDSTLTAHMECGG